MQTEEAVAQLWVLFCFVFSFLKMGPKYEIPNSTVIAFLFPFQPSVYTSLMLKERTTTKTYQHCVSLARILKGQSTPLGFSSSLLILFSLSNNPAFVCVILSSPGILSLPPGNSLDLPHINVIKFFLLETLVT